MRGIVLRPQWHNNVVKVHFIHRGVIFAIQLHCIGDCVFLKAWLWPETMSSTWRHGEMVLVLGLVMSPWSIIQTVLVLFLVMSPWPNGLSLGLGHGDMTKILMTPHTLRSSLLYIHYVGYSSEERRGWANTPMAKMSPWPIPKLRPCWSCHGDLTKWSQSWFWSLHIAIQLQCREFDIFWRTFTHYENVSVGYLK